MRRALWQTLHSSDGRFVATSIHSNALDALDPPLGAERIGIAAVADQLQQPRLAREDLVAGLL